MAAIYLAASAQAAFARGQAATARELLVQATRLRPQLTHAVPWFGVQTSLELARTHFALGDIEGARTLCPGGLRRHQPAAELGTLRAQADELRDRLAGVASSNDGWAATLTAAELRLLPFLTTHLSFQEIGERLYVSRNTVKTRRSPCTASSGSAAAARRSRAPPSSGSSRTSSCAVRRAFHPPRTMPGGPNRGAM